MTPLEDYPELTPTEGAILFRQVGIIIQRMAEAEITSRPDSSAIPRAAMTCGEAWTLVPVLFVLLAQKFPELSDSETLSELLHKAYLESAGGTLN